MLVDVTRPLVVFLIGFASLALALRVGIVLFLLISLTRYARYQRHKGEQPAVVGRALARYLLGELHAIVRMVRFTFVAFLDGYRLGKSKNKGAPVVCVHGFTQNGSNFFAMRRVLERAGHPTYAPTLGLPLAPIEHHALLLERAIERALDEHRASGRFSLVAHSMGGLVVRALLARRRDLAERLDAVVTIGTPHRGTAGARGFRLGRDVVAMQRGSTFLRDLPDVSALAPRARVVEIAARIDMVVYPLSTSLTSSAEAHVIEDVGHAGLLVSTSVFDLVKNALTPTETPPA